MANEKELTVEEQEKRVKRKRIIQLILNIVFYIIMAVVFVIIILNIVNKFTQKDTFGLFGYRAKVVVTKSMSYVDAANRELLEGHNDRLMVDDLIITKELDDDYEVQLYDIVTFKNSDGYTIVHRVVKIEGTAEGTFYTTRGDANSYSDDRKTRDELTGIVVKNMGSSAGKAVKFFQSVYGVVALIGIVFVCFLVTFILEVIKKKEAKASEDKKAEEMQKLIDKTNDEGETTAQETKAEEIKEDNSENNSFEGKNGENDGIIPVEEISREYDFLPANEDIADEEIDKKTEDGKLSGEEKDVLAESEDILNAIINGDTDKK